MHGKKSKHIRVCLYFTTIQHGCFYWLRPLSLLVTDNIANSFQLLQAACQKRFEKHWFSATCKRVVYCDPQGVAHVMIQSFQLSSCTLCNAPMQNVSETAESGLFLVSLKAWLLPLQTSRAVFSLHPYMQKSQHQVYSKVVLCYQQIFNFSNIFAENKMFCCVCTQVLFSTGSEQYKEGTSI